MATHEYKLADPGAWSKDFVDFVNSCLTRNANKRPSASDLLKHPFLV